MTILSSNEENNSKLSNIGCCQAVVSAMQANIEDADIAANGCIALSRLSSAVVGSYSSGSFQVAVAALSACGGREVLVSAMKRHTASSTVRTD